jgi:hypothetical protein
MRTRPLRSLWPTGAFFLLAAVPAAVRGETALWDQWTGRLNGIDRDLRAEGRAAAGAQARELAGEIANHGGGTMGYLRAHADEFDGNRVGQGYLAESIALGRAAAYVAIAEAAQGHEEPARWFWYLAQNLDSRWRDADLAPYGAAAPVLGRHRIQPAAGQAVYGLDVIDPVSPEASKRSRFKQPERTRVSYPKRTADLASRDRFSEVINVQITVEADGTVTQPIALDAPKYPGLIYRAFLALGEWRYRPATQDGQPVPYRLVVQVVFADDRPQQPAFASPLAADE